MGDQTAGQIAVAQMLVHNGFGGDEVAGYACNCGVVLHQPDPGQDMNDVHLAHLAAEIDAALI